jgi:hypothetical protein
MKNRSIVLTASLCAWAALASCMAGTKTGADSAYTAESASDLAAALPARGPHPSLGEQEGGFGRFVGTWQVEYMDVMKDGTQLHRTGLFIVGWIMYGRAIQDLWIVDPSPGHAEREVYADVRYFDPKSLTWPSVFFDPEHASMAKFSGGAVSGDRVVFQSSEIDNKQARWSFENIGPNTLVFRDETSSDDGRTWQLHGEYHMRRQAFARPRA